MILVAHEKFLTNAYSVILSEAEGSISTALSNNYAVKDSSTSLRMTTNQRCNK